jgi:hypothetical protein
MDLLSDAILELISNSALYATISENGNAKAKSDYCGQNNIGKIVKICNELVK